MIKEYPIDPMYLVTDKGRVWSRFTRRSLTPYKGANGYYCVNVRNSDGKRFAQTIHRMVAITFLNPVEGKTHVNHIDSNKLNNCVTNLEWCTNAENRAHSVKAGTHSHGQEHTSAKLTSELVEDICKMFSSGLTIGDIQKTVQVSRDSLLNIRARRTWKHISCNYNWHKANTANKLAGSVTTISKESTPK
jgi:hypothetical protein